MHVFNTQTFLTYSRRVSCPPSKDERSNGLENMLSYGTRKEKGTCYLDHGTKPSYREVKRSYNFFMIIKNNVLLKTGTYPEPLEIDYPKINHYEIGKPSPQFVNLLCTPSLKSHIVCFDQLCVVLFY